MKPAILSYQLAATLTLLAVACSKPEPHRQASPATPDEVHFASGAPQLAYITAEPVLARTDKVVAVLPAQVVMDEDHTVRISSPVTGRILRLAAEPGDHVSRGQAVAYITSGDAAQASSDLVRARAAETLTATALHRAEDLYAHHVIALKDLEQARSDDAQAGAELSRATARATQLGTAGSSGSTVSSTFGGTFVLRAPIAGEIVDRTANPGAEVAPGTAAPLFTVSDLSVVWLTAAAYQRDLASVQRGQQLVFTTDAAPGRRFVGTVSYVGDALDPQSRTLTIRATLPNPNHILRPETFGEARLLARADDGVPSVPTTALVTHGQSTAVFVEIGPGRFERRDVVVGDDDGITATITSGIHVGERIVTRGSILLEGEADAGGTQ